MKHLLFFGLLLEALCVHGQSPQPELNVIYGAHHIFTIATPSDWINDKEMAKKVGLVSFFYPKDDSTKGQNVYFYAMGYDKDENNKDLESFAKGDLESFRKKYPKLTTEKIELGLPGGIIDAIMYSFSNLTDRYKEDVVYLETDSAILVLIYAAATKEIYNSNLSIFNSFVASFQYRGNDPKPYLDWVKKHK